MSPKGMEQLRKHFPELNSKAGSLILGLSALGVLAATTIYFITTDQIPTWSIDSQIVVIAIAFLMISFFFSKKKSYQEKYGELAYRSAFSHYALPGLAIMLAAIVHIGYMNGPELPPGTVRTVLTVIGAYWVIVGAALWIRSIFTIGFDNLAMLYVYFPEESRMVDTEIYSVLRHPVYAGVLRLGLGLALINCNANALFFALLMPLGLTGWIRLVEEKELLERIPSYADYRKRVPAFWPHLKDIGKYWKFLLMLF
jgi:protein-S-isoprenylcysteine O-methyltransferase Ste14